MPADNRVGGACVLLMSPFLVLFFCLALWDAASTFYNERMIAKKEVQGGLIVQRVLETGVCADDQGWQVKCQILPRKSTPGHGTAPQRMLVMATSEEVSVGKTRPLPAL